MPRKIRVTVASPMMPKSRMRIISAAALTPNIFLISTRFTEAEVEAAAAHFPDQLVFRHQTKRWQTGRKSSLLACRRGCPSPSARARGPG